jgi:RHS repeat-associated protein
MNPLSRTLVAAALLVPFVTGTVAHGYTTDVFATSSPSPTPHAGGERPGGGAPEHVDSSGAAVYSIAIPTPPNRRGHVPELALTYSSRNPIRGGVAMGWTLSVPRIEVDTSRGRLGEPTYTSSTGGRLIRSNDPTEPGWTAYRGREDGSYTRFEAYFSHLGARIVEWRARTTDGTIYYFGETLESQDLPHHRSSAAEGRWYVTRIVDRFGNEIEFTYAKVETDAPEGVDKIPVDIALEQVRYGANPGAGLGHHVRIRFEHAPALDRCRTSNVPIGAQFDFRTGFPIYAGARRLTAVVAEVAAGGTFVPRRRLDLEYDMAELACQGGAAHAPLRVLTAVRDTGISPEGVATSMPPVRFTYNRRERAFDREQNVGTDVHTAGLRRRAAGFWRDPMTRMLLDLDGDGLPDRLQVAGDPRYCAATYRRNLGDGQFAPAQPIGHAVPDRDTPVMPTIPWKGAEKNPQREYCSLTFQVSQPVNYDQWDPDGEQMCRPLPTYPPPPSQARPDEAETHHAYQFLDLDGDGRPELVTAIESFALAYRPDLDPRVKTLLSCAPYECQGEWREGVGCVTDYVTTGQGCDPERLRYERPCGRYVYRAYPNLGDGRFGPMRPFSGPIPLDPMVDEDGGSDSTLLDLDGDGVVDAVQYVHITGSPEHQRFDLSRGWPGGGFRSAPDAWPLPAIWGNERGAWRYVRGKPQVGAGEEILGEPVCSPNPPDLDEGGDGCNYPVLATRSWTAASLEDINGDGLPDYVDARGDVVRAFYNHGAGFETYEVFPAPDRGTPLISVHADPHVRLALDVSDRKTLGPGLRRVRLVDFDGDGLQDLFVAANPGQWDEDGNYIPPWERDEPDLYLNVQDRFVRLGSSEAVRRAEAALSGSVTVDSPGWRESGAFVDLDGDGLPEAIRDGIALSDHDSQPMRALASVENGRGSRIEYDYRAVSGGAVPYPVWVVREVRVNPGLDADGAPGAVATTRYDHEGAAYAQDLDGVWGFRGFARTTVTSPSGARRVTVRSYDQHYAGLVTEERVEDNLLGNGQHHAATITRTTYTRDVITGYQGDWDPGVLDPDPNAPPPPGRDVVVHHVRVRTSRTCDLDQTPAACEASGAVKVHRERWIPLPANAPAMFVKESDWIGTQQSIHPGMQVYGHSYHVFQEPGRYLLLPHGSSRYLFDAQNVQRLAAVTYRYYDASKRAQLWESRWVEDGQPFSVIATGHDLATGVQISEVRPNQFPSWTPQTTFTYDPTWTFVAATRNELGHVVQTRHDPATGTLLERRGPNVRPGGNPPAREGFVRTIDGFGRVLTESVAIDDAAAGYVMVPMGRTTYVDAPRTRVTTESRIELDDDRWARREAELDGLGREVVSRTFVSGQDAIESRWYHDAAGNLVRARVPRPGSTEPTAFVEWRFVHDTLGRIVKEVQPARSGCAADPSGWAFCGQAWTYDGLVTTRTDVTGSLGGTISQTVTVQDVFGRLIRVEEDTDGEPAVTSYAYDGNDNVNQIVSADGVVTTMHHDALSHRRAITRGGRTWAFGYDATGNLVSVVAPRPPGTPPEAYTTTIAYDLLDRETSRLVGRRDLTDDELATWGDGSTVRAYDLGENGVGRLARVTQRFGANDRHELRYGYDARGHVTEEHREVSILGGRFGGARTAARTYTAHGAPGTITAADGVGDTRTTFAFAYDDRGLAYTVDWVGHDALQFVDRARDGRTTRRYDGPTPWIVRDAVPNSRTEWSYDELGRVTQYLVRSARPGHGQLRERAGERFVFDGAGNVATMSSGLWPGTEPVTWSSWSFAYDPQHQLVQAQGPLGYEAAFAFTPAGKLAHAAVSAGPEAVRVHTRDVAYRYGDGVTVDPDAPIALDAPGVGTWMAIAYDAAGNAITRTIGGALYRHRYDGAGQQREVIAPDGSRELAWYGPDRMRTLVAELDPSGAVQRVRWQFAEAEVWFDGSGAVEREAATAAIGGAAARVVDHARRELLHADPRGHLLAVVDDTRQLRAGFHYGPYGELLEESGVEPEDNLERFNGKPWSPITGLHYYGHRYYDEYTLTWTQADPAFRLVPDLAGGPELSLYSFTRNNPLRFVDPDGLEADDGVNPDACAWTDGMSCLAEPPPPDSTPAPTAGCGIDQDCAFPSAPDATPEPGEPSPYQRYRQQVRAQHEKGKSSAPPEVEAKKKGRSPYEPSAGCSATDGLNCSIDATRETKIGSFFGVTVSATKGFSASAGTDGISAGYNDGAIKVEAPRIPGWALVPVAGVVGVFLSHQPSVEGGMKFEVGISRRYLKLGPVTVGNDIKVGAPGHR